MSELFDPLAEILAVAKQQKARVQMMIDKEKEVNLTLDSTSKAVKDYQDTLVTLQRMQIEMEQHRQKNGPKKTIGQQIQEAMGASERIMKSYPGD